MAEGHQHGGAQRAERQAIAGHQQWRRCPILGPDVEVALPKHNGRELAHLVARERLPAGQPDFDRSAALQVTSLQARGQRRCIIRDHEITGSKNVHQVGARCVVDVSGAVDDEQSRIHWPLNRTIGCDDHAACLSRSSAAAIVSATSRAASSGRFRVAGSASGTASA